MPEEKRRVSVSTREFFAILNKRCSKSNVVFMVTFVGIIILLGGIGIWMGVYQYFSRPTESAFISEALFTYGIALLATMGAEFHLEDSGEDSDEALDEGNIGRKAMRQAGFFVCAVAVLLLMWGYNVSAGTISWQSSVATALIWVVWFFMNVGKEKFDDKVNPKNPLGGDPSVANLGTGT